MEYVSPSSYYKLNLPDGWVFSENGDVVNFYDRVGGVGALQISSYLIDKGTNIDIASELTQILINEIGLGEKDIFTKIYVQNDVAYFTLLIDNRYWEYYLLFKNRKLLFITYNCSQTDRYAEKNVIDEIVQSISL